MAASHVKPSDEAEQDRMELLHHIWRLLLDGELLLSKPKKVDRVLDIGTGEWLTFARR